MNDISRLYDADQELLNNDVSDDALESAAGMSAAAQAASSLWSSFSVAGCTCVE